MYIRDVTTDTWKPYTLGEHNYFLIINDTDTNGIDLSESEGNSIDFQVLAGDNGFILDCFTADKIFIKSTIAGIPQNFRIKTW